TWVGKLQFKQITFCFRSLINIWLNGLYAHVVIYAILLPPKVRDNPKLLGSLHCPNRRQFRYINIPVCWSLCSSISEARDMLFNCIDLVDRKSNERCFLCFCKLSTAINGCCLRNLFDHPLPKRCTKRTLKTTPE